MIVRILLSALFALSLPVQAERIQSWPFKVFLDEAEIGTHQFEIHRHANGVEIRSRAQFDVKVLFFNAYRYRHEAVERWQGDCLASLQSQTNDNGEQLAVQAQLTDGVLKIQVNETQTRYALPCPKSFAYWNPAFLDAKRLLHPQTGQLVPVDITRVGRDRLQFGDEWITSQRYVLRGPDMRIDLWYSENGHWLALQAPAQGGRTLRYRLDRIPGCALRPAQEVCS